MVNKQFKICCQILFFLLFCLDLNSQQIRFFVTSDADRVAVNNTFTLSFILENAEASGFTLPDLSAFRVVAGPATSTSVSIINGRRSSQVSYRYTLLATREGRFTIPSASIISGNKKYSSNPIIIEVVKASKTEDTSGPESEALSFVKMEISENQIYIGQQAVLNFVLYTRQNVESFNFLNEPAYIGFFATPMTDIRHNPKKVVVSGKEYYSQILRSVILYPQQTGVYSLEPVVCQLGIPVEGSTGGFFFSREIRRESVTTNNLAITVKDVPKPSPESFSGAVGDYRVSATINKSYVSTDDAIVIRMEVDGNGDPKIVQAPKQMTDERLEYYQPNIIKDENYAKNGMIYNKKEFEFIIIPKKDTVFTLSPEFSFYSTLSKKYETVSTGPFTVNVTKGTRTITRDNREVTVAGDISGIDKSDRLSKISSIWFGSIEHAGVLGILFLIGLFIFLKDRKRKREEAIDPAERRRIEARNVAMKNLSIASNLMEKQNFRAFFDEISKALNGYLKNKFGVPNEDLNNQQIHFHMTQHGIDTSLINEFLNVHAKCEKALFAGQTSDMKEVFRQTSSLIEAIEAGS